MDNKPAVPTNTMADIVNSNQPPSEAAIAKARNTPTFQKWAKAEDGEEIIYANGKYVKGSIADEERLITRLIYKHAQSLKQKANGREKKSQKKVKLVQPFLSTFDTPLTIKAKNTKTYLKKWANAKIGETIEYFSLKFTKDEGGVGEEKLLKYIIKNNGWSEGDSKGEPVEVALKTAKKQKLEGELVELAGKTVKKQKLESAPKEVVVKSVLNSEKIFDETAMKNINSIIIRREFDEVIKNIDTEALKQNLLKRYRSAALEGISVYRVGIELLMTLLRIVGADVTVLRQEQTKK